MKKNYEITERDEEMFNFIFDYKCMNYEQLFYFNDYNKDYIRKRMNLFKRNNLVDDMEISGIKYWFLKPKGLKYIHANIQNTKPSISIINHTSLVLDTMIYLKNKYPNYTFQSERQYIQENGLTFGRKTTSSIPDLFVFDEELNLVYVVEVEITRKQKSVFDKKVTQIYRNFLMKNEGSKILWVVHENFKNFEERLSENKRLGKHNYDILFIEDLTK